MKNYLFLAILLSTFIYAQVTTVFAQVQEPANTEGTIDAEIGVTQDLISQVGRDLNKAPTLDFKVSDYRRISPAFRGAVDQAMIQFEQELKTNFFPPLRAYANEYISTYGSKQIGDTQKNSLLTQLDAARPALQNDLSQKYSEALNRLYSAIGGGFLYQEPQFIEGEGTTACQNALYAYHLTTKVDGQIKNSDSFCFQMTTAKMKNIHNNHYWSVSFQVNGSPLYELNDEELADNHGTSEKTLLNYMSEYDVVAEALGKKLAIGEGNIPPYLLSVWLKRDPTYLKFINSLYTDQIFKTVTQGCESKSCVAFRVADYQNFLSLVQEKLGQPLSFHLADPDTDVRISPQASFDIPFILDQLSRTDYPNTVNNFPFDTP